jgi:hypothetical protein
MNKNDLVKKAQPIHIGCVECAKRSGMTSGLATKGDRGGSRAC